MYIYFEFHYVGYWALNKLLQWPSVCQINTSSSHLKNMCLNLAITPVSKNVSHCIVCDELSIV